MQVTSARPGPVRLPGSGRNTARRPKCSVSVRALQTSNAALELDQAKELLEARSHLFVDMRSAKAYDDEHVTKPVKMTVNVPFEQGSVDKFVGEIMVKFRPGAKLLLVDETGEDGIKAAEVLREAGYDGVYGVVGGYAGWLKNYTTTGRRRIQGKFVSTGREALKSGLDLDPAVASTYEENHGKVDLSLPSNRG